MTCSYWRKFIFSYICVVWWWMVNQNHKSSWIEPNQWEYFWAVSPCSGEHMCSLPLSRHRGSLSDPSDNLNSELKHFKSHLGQCNSVYKCLFIWNDIHISCFTKWGTYTLCLWYVLSGFMHFIPLCGGNSVCAALEYATNFSSQ